MMGKEVKDIIEEYEATIHRVNTLGVPYYHLVNFEPLIVTPYVDSHIALSLPNFVVAVLCLTRTPFYCADKKTLDILKNRWSQLQKNPNFIAGVVRRMHKIHQER